MCINEIKSEISKMSKKARETKKSINKNESTVEYNINQNNKDT